MKRMSSDDYIHVFYQETKSRGPAKKACEMLDMYKEGPLAVNSFRRSPGAGKSVSFQDGNFEYLIRGPHDRQ